ncbi:SGNH/GDSL hydrolase family protein [Paracoccus sp. SY]|uniref:SGNH/GDSL hydrolase family protein n=1 Tax=Paracoccus sp. SY TaxID=1330255 RepID=UPI0011AFCD33|nr:SGNH/GDSL hydrolase family protein [Paracoccus sp. SY]
MRRFFLAIAVIAAPLTAQASVVTDAFTSFWALGDSLTDNGNLPLPVFAAGRPGAPISPEAGEAAYYAPNDRPRFSNGRTFAEYVAAEFRAAGRPTGNLARGGAEAAEPIDPADPTPGLLAQRQQLAAASGGFGTRPLVSILMGANDIFAGLASGDPLANAIGAATRAADAVADTASFLGAHRVRDFLIANLPDLGATPAFALFQPQARLLASAATTAYNARLAANVAALEAGGLNVISLDIHAQLNGILADPAAFGYGDATLPCLFPSPSVAAAFGQAPVCSDTESLSRLFFDPVHPNLLAHAQFGQTALNLIEADLAPVPLAGGLPLLLTGLGAFVALRRRRA